MKLEDLVLIDTCIWVSFFSRPQSRTKQIVDALLEVNYDLFSQLPDDSPPQQPAQPQVLSVGQLTGHIKDLLETSFGSVWVAGEISNLARPRSGHCYLTLKDDQAQIRCACGATRPRGSASICTTGWKWSAEGGSTSMRRGATTS